MDMIHSVVGYLPDSIAKGLDPKVHHKEALHVHLERGGADHYVAIQPSDVLGVLKGASQGGSTSVQVFVKQSARLDTVSRGAISDFLKPINDLSFLRIRPPINAIYFDPRAIDKLLQIDQSAR